MKTNDFIFFYLNSDLQNMVKILIKKKQQTITVEKNGRLTEKNFKNPLKMDKENRKCLRISSILYYNLYNKVA